jgi:hypothetical protein
MRVQFCTPNNKRQLSSLHSRGIVENTVVECRQKYSKNAIDSNSSQFQFVSSRSGSEFSISQVRQVCSTKGEIFKHDNFEPCPHFAIDQRASDVGSCLGISGFESFIG